MTPQFFLMQTDILGRESFASLQRLDWVTANRLLRESRHLFPEVTFTIVVETRMWRRKLELALCPETPKGLWGKLKAIILCW